MTIPVMTLDVQHASEGRACRKHFAGDSDNL
jgi:hypothetical protein